MAVVVGTFVVASSASDIGAAPADDLTALPRFSGAVLDVDADVPADAYLIGNVAAVNESSDGGFLAVSGGAFGGTSTVNTAGGGVRSNAFVVDPRGDGAFGVRVGGVGAHHVVVDSVASLERNAATTIFPAPRRITDTRTTADAVVAGGELRVDIGAGYAGKFALVNLTVDRSDGPGFHAAYPCAQGYRGTSSINVSGRGAHAVLNLVKVDDEGAVCIRSHRPAVGIVVDLLGVIDSDADAFERLLDTRDGGRPLEAGEERRVVVGEPNSVFVGTVVSANPSGRGWLAAYTEAGEYNGTSTLNSDGVHSVAGFVMMATDDSGAIHVRSQPGPAGLRTDLVIDGTTVPELTPHLTPRPARLRDTRDEPLVFTAEGLEGAELGTDADVALDALAKRLGTPTTDRGWEVIPPSVAPCNPDRLRPVSWDFGELGVVDVMLGGPDSDPESAFRSEEVLSARVRTDRDPTTFESRLDRVPAVEAPGGVRLGDPLSEILRRHPTADYPQDLEYSPDITFAGVDGWLTSSEPRRLAEVFVGLTVCGV